MIQSINPSTEQLIKEYKPYSDKQVLSILEEVANEYTLWRFTSFEERSKILHDIANALNSNIEEHARMISLEIGKPIVESRMEVEKCVWVLQYFADNAEDFLKSKTIKTGYRESYVQYDSLGVILGVMPWNFPYWQVIRFIAPVLMAGNTCVVKHASNVSGCSLLIEELIIDHTPFKNMYRTVLIGSNHVEMMIQHNAVKGVSLTGSDAAGSAVGMQAGKEIKRSVLELGGSDPFIVLDDADIDKASKTAITARFFNTGQSCIAAKRFLVHEGVYDRFVDNVHQGIKSLIVGDALNESTQIGPLAKQEFVEDIDSLVQSSINDGAQCLVGGIGKGCYYMPTLLVDVKEYMSVFKQETFGPVLCVTKIKDAEDGVRLANQSKYGLGGSLWTSDMEFAKKLTKKIDTGAIFINEMTKSDPRLPFGGINKSGYGIELSAYGILEFVNTKTIVIG
jgi:succinate-semialdehyde dehydrogenase/glutarate-semialdehyde dehydrogenase